MTNYQFSNKTAVVSGASSGIGKCIAESLDSVGVGLFCIASSPVSQEKIQQQFPNARVFVCDFKNFYIQYFDYPISIGQSRFIEISFVERVYVSYPSLISWAMETMLASSCLLGSFVFLSLNMYLRNCNAS